MIERRPFHSLSGNRCDWLQARHHFSPEDPDSGWGALRIWNDDEIAANSGFPPHAHANMEIITYVRDGAVSHRDSVGNAGRIVAGDVQVMSAGTGIRHAEFNLEPQLRASSRSGLSRAPMAALRHGAPSPSRNKIEQVASSPSRAVSRPIARHCRSARKRGYSAPL